MNIKKILTVAVLIIGTFLGTSPVYAQTGTSYDFTTTIGSYFDGTTVWNGPASFSGAFTLGSQVDTTYAGGSPTPAPAGIYSITFDPTIRFNNSTTSSFTPWGNTQQFYYNINTNSFFNGAVGAGTGSYLSYAYNSDPNYAWNPTYSAPVGGIFGGASSLQTGSYPSVYTSSTIEPAGAPEMNASFIPQVGLLLACLFFLFGRKKENTDAILTA